MLGKSGSTFFGATVILPTACNIGGANSVGTLLVTNDGGTNGLNITYTAGLGITSSCFVVARARVMLLSNPSFVMTKSFANPIQSPQFQPVPAALLSNLNIAQIPMQQAQNKNQMGPNYNSGTPANSGPWF